MEQAIFGAGCFWHVEEDFRKLQGVLNTEVGYSGGTTENATYKQVCSGGTGHAEVVRLEFDPSQISFDRLLEEFWDLHDPTSLNRQGPDVGEQYRSAIFYTSPEQKAAAEEAIEKLAASGRYKRPVVTQIAPAGPFWKAEDYHQKYLAKRGLSRCPV